MFHIDERMRTVKNIIIVTAVILSIAGCRKGDDSSETNPNNKIYYTTTDGLWPISTAPSTLGSNMISDTYENGQGIMTFLGPVIWLGDHSFANTTRLKTITIPSSVRQIGYNPFAYCDNLSDFYGKFSSSDNRCLIQDGTLKSFAPAEMTVYSVPAGVTVIVKHAFINNTLNEIDIPDSVTEIESEAFRSSINNIIRINIGKGITKIGNYALYCGTYHCYVYCKAAVPPVAEGNLFYDCDKITVYVPRESVEAYKAASGWDQYAENIFGYDF